MCSYTPRFSYKGLKTVICACPRCPVYRGVVHALAEVAMAGCTGGVWLGGYTGCSTTQPPSIPGSSPEPAKRARKACRAWSGGFRAAGALGDGGGVGMVPTLRARSVLPRRPFLGPYLGNAASWPIRTRLRSFYYKVSQNSKVSPKSTQKACHSP